MPQRIRETSKILEAAAAEAKKSGRMLIQHISPGWGSSGYYSAQVLEQVIEDKVIPAGTHMYADHPTDLEEMERPVRSIRDLMAVTVEDGRLATEADVKTWGADLGAAVSEVQVVPQYQEFLEIVKDSIGTSIRGSGSAVEGAAEGRSGVIFESLNAPVLSVDFVTRAGRGGRVLQVMESAKATSRAIAHGISEATVNDTREALQTALRDTYGGEKTYVWVRDFDETTVWFEVENADDSGIFAQTYEMSDTAGASLSGDRTEVQVKTTYVPTTRSDSNTTSTQESEEDTMPKIQIEEADHTALVEKAGRVDTVEAERDTAIRERNEARAAVPALTKARALVVEANKELPATAIDRIVVEATRTIPLTEAGQLDEEALTKAVESARTAEETYLAGLAESAGAGAVTGFGSPAGGDTAVNESSKPSASPWGRKIAQEA